MDREGLAIWEKETFWYVLIGIVIGIIITFLFSFSLFTKPKKVCGNSICEIGEDSISCCKDCGCPKGYECKENKCIVKEAEAGFCGDGKCQKNENCWRCPQDCKCSENEYCSSQLERCVRPTCGNEICEPFESPENCCIDCNCTIPGEICDLKTLKCRMREVNVSDEKAIELVKRYLEERNEKVSSIEVMGIFEWKNKVGKKVEAKVEGEEWFRAFLVTENEEVIELPVV